MFVLVAEAGVRFTRSLRTKSGPRLCQRKGEVPDADFVMRREFGLVLQPESLAESRLLGALSSQHAITLVHEGVTLLLLVR
jgi:hypothetical protein